MKNIAKNWKTTLAGLLVILIPIAVKLGYITSDMAAAIVTVLTGLGFLAAKDGNVTGGTNPATEEAQTRVDANASK